jgi:hypothetical protein
VIVIGEVAVIADFSGLVLSILAEDEEKRNKFFTSVILDVIFKGASKFIPNYPVWNNDANRYRSSSKGQFMKTRIGKTVDLVPPVTGIVVPPLFEGNE